VDLLLFPIAFLVIGVAVGRWWVVAAAVGVVGAVAFFLVLNDGWYGAGWGDFGIALNVVMGALTVVLAVVGVAVSKAWARLRRDNARVA
jgi:hypothetical protein